ncbi:hypothetical protein RR46_11769 [Papilio xuthus]|uniref:Uncharacterized protein n=1 Tax=Papilio xuthus TaxID=66420 RepID=A0A194PUF1_PAPXU|nr:hypothetical protein RR46_11769 [Papilio xuthus]
MKLNLGRSRRATRASATLNVSLLERNCAKFACECVRILIIRAAVLFIIIQHPQRSTLPADVAERPVTVMMAYHDRSSTGAGVTDGPQATNDNGGRGRRVGAATRQPKSALSFDFLSEVRKVFTGGTQCLFSSGRGIRTRSNLRARRRITAYPIFKAPAYFRVYKRCGV